MQNKKRKSVASHVSSLQSDCANIVFHCVNGNLICYLLFLVSQCKIIASSCLYKLKGFGCENRPGIIRSNENFICEAYKDLILLFNIVLVLLLFF